MKEYSIVGKRIPRIDAREKVTGAGMYIDDIELPNMLYGKILRSPFPHAKIMNIDISRAKRLIGIKAIATSKDTNMKKYSFLNSPEFADKYPFAIDKVRNIGDEILAIAGTDKDIIEEAIEIIKLDFEELPSVFDPEEAMSPEAPLIHEERKNNISMHLTHKFGDIEKGFGNSDLIVEDRFIIEPGNSAALEPEGAVAYFDSSERLTVWTSIQSLYILRTQLSNTLDIREDRIRLISAKVGGAFCGKEEMLGGEFSASLLSRMTGRPVKVIFNREETFTLGRAYKILDFKIGAKKDGRIEAIECKFIVDNGSYNGTSPITMIFGGMYLNIPYMVKHVKYEGYLVYTNNIPSVVQRGGGGDIDFRFPYEIAMDILAEELNMDPLELRLKNALKPGDITGSGSIIKSCGLSECINKASYISKWGEKRNRLIPGKGIGIASGDHLGGISKVTPVDPIPSAVIKLDHRGSISLFTGAVDVGQGSDTALTQIAAEELGVDVDDVNIYSADTDISPIDIGTYGNRITMIVGMAVKNAANDLKRKIIEIAAKKLGVDKNSIAIKNSTVYVNDKKIPFFDAITGDNPVIGIGYYEPEVDILDIEKGGGNIVPTYSFASHIAEVEVDMETGFIKIESITAAHDLGFAINPMGAEGQIEGAVANGIGQALTESFFRDKGLNFSLSLLNYKIPTSLEISFINTILVETIDPEGPFGAKGLGDAAQTPVSPSILNAIYDAIGIRLKRIPVNPEDILRRKDDKKG